MFSLRYVTVLYNLSLFIQNETASFTFTTFINSFNVLFADQHRETLIVVHQLQYVSIWVLTVRVLLRKVSFHGQNHWHEPLIKLPFMLCGLFSSKYLLSRLMMKWNRTRKPFHFIFTWFRQKSEQNFPRNFDRKLTIPRFFPASPCCRWLSDFQVFKPFITSVDKQIRFDWKLRLIETRFKIEKQIEWEIRI